MITPSTSNAKRQPKPTEVLLSPTGTEVYIGKGRTQQIYDLAEFPCGLPGRAFQLVKIDGPEAGVRYNVFVSLDTNAEPHRCDCLGFEHAGVCRHIDSLLALERDGQLVDPKAMTAYYLNPTPAAHDNDACGQCCEADPFE